MPPASIQRPKSKHHRALSFIEKLSGYSYGTLFGIWASMALGFAFIYFGLTFVGDGSQAPTTLAGIQPFFIRFMDALYFSIITATSTGYGDITPVGVSRVLAALQSISALLVFAVFVTKLVSHQQELTLTEVHRLTFEDVFHNTREGMYIVRKDLDHIIKTARQQKDLDAEHWENLTTAYRQLQTLFEEIPDFYENEVHHYTIDKKREQLLLEASHRTLHRLNLALDTLSEEGIDWVSHRQSMQELSELVRIVTSITPLWQERSPYEELEAFEDIIQMKERMHLKIMKSVD